MRATVCLREDKPRFKLGRVRIDRSSFLKHERNLSIINGPELTFTSEKQFYPGTVTSECLGNAIEDSFVPPPPHPII